MRCGRCPLRNREQYRHWLPVWYGSDGRAYRQRAHLQRESPQAVRFYRVRAQTRRILHRFVPIRRERQRKPDAMRRTVAAFARCRVTRICSAARGPTPRVCNGAFRSRTYKNADRPSGFVADSRLNTRRVLLRHAEMLHIPDGSAGRFAACNSVRWVFQADGQQPVSQPLRCEWQSLKWYSRFHRALAAAALCHRCEDFLCKVSYGMSCGLLLPIG